MRSPVLGKNCRDGDKARMAVRPGEGDLMSAFNCQLGGGGGPVGVSRCPLKTQMGAALGKVGSRSGWSKKWMKGMPVMSSVRQSPTSDEGGAVLTKGVVCRVGSGQACHDTDTCCPSGRVNITMTV